MGIFKAYDIRGIYDKELTLDKAFLIGYYFVKINEIKRVIVGFDCRDSSEVLFRALSFGILKGGAEVEFVGKVSTPAFYYSLINGDGTGIMITASHNPKEYNGFKIVKGLEGYDSSTGLKELEEYVESDPERVRSEFDGSLIEDLPLDEFVSNYGVKVVPDTYLDFLKEKFRDILTEEEIMFLKNKIVGFDFSNGMSGKYIMSICGEFGLNAIFFNENEDGNFPAHLPDPLKAGEYVKGLAGKTDFDFLFCFDGDGDRIGVFTRYGDFVYSDYIIALFIEFFYEKFQATRFTYDLRVSRIVKDIIEKYNLGGYECRVGRSFIKKNMEEKDCFFGGELSGHFFFKEFGYFDNPDLAFIYILKVVAQDKEDISAIIERYSTKYYKEKELNVIVDDKNRFLEVLKERFDEYLVSTLDGYSFDMGNVWFNARASNTEPLVRINLEGYSKEEVGSLRKDILEIVKEISD